MEKEPAVPTDQEETEAEALELVLFQVPECYVYLIPPRKSAASYRFYGILTVISKGEECIIRLEDKKTNELYARAFLRNGKPHLVEPVIDSSRYFVLRVEENIERTEAYDFQAALHDHMKYLDKKKTAKEMEQKFRQTSLVDYSLKEGETIVLQLKNVSENNSPEKKANQKEPLICIRPPPPLPAPLSPSATVDKSSSNLPPNLNLEGTSKHAASESTKHESKETSFSGNQSTQDIPDDDFGDFQAAV
ncbi:hypothetical protein D8674_034896 [Pyrus ussuriensis x Pyrus communis]|uniref:NECAP PHear domain-containing protein n=1 Tax=Pyrus ussuriensis x Pyrus communis TaxID=2448454 RepID=A0A5N5GGV5_9ROSA|nr:hypothetical protein D8674_034896 [Pyrus ussuriensis x Pyrus communis]